MERTARLAMSVTAVLLLAACTASPGGSPSPTGAPPTTPSPSQTTSPSASPLPSPTTTPDRTPSPIGDPKAVIVKVESTGGMMPIWETLRWYPSVALYGDGRLILQGAQIEIFPGPALPSLWVTHLSEQGIEQVLGWAADAGLQGPDRELGEQMMDAGVTVYTIARPEGTHRTIVHSNMNNDPQINALVEFQDVVMNARQWLDDGGVVGEDVPYVAESMRVIAFPAQVGPDGELASTLDWPLDTPINQLGTSFGEPAEYRCAEVTGDDLALLMPMVKESNELTNWRSDDELYQLYLHPLLPDEEACPGF